jgi:hypothetical protein
MGVDPYFGTMRGEWIYNLASDGDKLFIALAGDPGQPSIWQYQLTPTTSQKLPPSEQNVNN